jgi:colanic acid/amylovoran biosynthesis glycosyltransferase
VRIAIVGGVFGSTSAYRSAVLWTPETTLVRGLSELGHDVEALPHSPRTRFNGFDIVHVHHLSWGAAAASTDRSSTPFVFTLHATTPMHPHIAAFVMSRADGVVALWKNQADAFIEGYRLSGAEVAVIPNGVDPGTFPFTQPDPPGVGPWELLYVGQLIPGKGVELLIRAVADLRTRHNVRLSLSYHQNMMEDELRLLCDELGIGDIVRFLGRTPQEQLGAVYQSSHIVVLPSTDKALYEALPSVLTEAMFVGAFPVATNLGGISDQLAGFGIVVPPGDVAALARGIDDATQAYPKHLVRAREMSESAKERFSIQQMVASHERLYERVVAKRPARPRRHAAAQKPGTLIGGPSLRLASAIRARSGRDPG